MAGCFIVDFSVDIIASHVQLAAVLHHFDVRVKDIGLWGYDWVLAAADTSFLKVKTLGMYHRWWLVLMLSRSSHVV